MLTKCRIFLSRYEIRDPHLVEENVLQILEERADFDSYKPRPFNMREFYDRTGHDIKDMLLSCSYRGEECAAEDFKVVSCARKQNQLRPMGHLIMLVIQNGPLYSLLCREV